MNARCAVELVPMAKTTATLVRDVLRSLDDPEALAANDLVAPVLANGDRSVQCERLRSAVLQALEAMLPEAGCTQITALHARRQYDILMRYDVRREPLNDVLRALWIEKSQFYRERTRALRRLGHAIESWVASGRAQTAFSSDEYRIATALQRSGNSLLARAMFERLASTSSGADKARCLLRIAELHVDGGDVASASRFVASAMQHSDPNADDAEVVTFDAGIVEAQIAWAAGASKRALSILVPTIAGMRTLAGRSDSTRVLLGRALALQANIAFHTSTLDECARLVNQGCSVLRGGDDRTAETFADLLTIRTSIHTAKIGALDEAKRYDDVLMAFAQEHGLVRKLAVGVKDLAVISHYGGNRPLAEIYADQALALSTAVCSSKERAVATFEWAHMRIETGDAAEMQRVRKAVEGTRSHLPRGGFWWAYSLAIEGFALLAQDEPLAALAQSQTALEAFAAMRSDRGVGIARALQAKALRVLGEANESRTRAEQALDHFARAPQTFWIRYAEKLLPDAS